MSALIAGRRAGHLGDRILLRDHVVAAATNSIVFDDLPQDLIYRIEGIIVVGGTGIFSARLNGNAGAVYDHLSHRFQASGVTTAEVLGDDLLQLFGATALSAGNVALCTIEVSSNARAAGFLLRAESAVNTGNSGETYVMTGGSSENAELTSIQLLSDAPFSANTVFGVGTRLRLTGMGAR